jgi:hypothetical protein
MGVVADLGIYPKAFKKLFQKYIVIRQKKNVMTN